MAEFKVGDKVRFKSWDRLVDEFGFIGNGVIDCPYHFTKHMRYLCGSVTVIKLINPHNDTVVCEDRQTRMFTISQSMLLHYNSIENLMELKKRIKGM